MRLYLLDETYTNDKYNLQSPQNVRIKNELILLLQKLRIVSEFIQLFNIK